MQNWKGILFDFDGVVVDSTPLHLKGWEAAYRQLFKESLDPETLLSLVGRSTSAIGRLLAERSGFPMAKAELVRRKNIYITENLSEIRPIPGLESFLFALEKKSIPHGIVSNAPVDFIHATLQHLGVTFPFVLGLENYQRPKPDAEPYMKGAQRIKGVKFPDHHKILVLEDSTHGLQAAVAAHMTPVGICSQHSSDVLLSAGARYCFQTLEDAIALLSHCISD